MRNKNKLIADCILLILLVLYVFLNTKGVPLLGSLFLLAEVVLCVVLVFFEFRVAYGILCLLLLIFLEGLTHQQGSENRIMLVWIFVEAYGLFFLMKWKLNSKTNSLTEEHQRLERSHSSLVQEQLSAKRIFDRIVYAGCLNRPEIRYRLSPNSIFNGDVLLAQEKPDGSMMLFLGDFTGHGLPAAMGILPCSEIFYSMVRKGFSIAHVITEINRKLQDVLPEGVFCAGLMFEIDLWGRTIKCWNGGIPEPIVFGDQGQIKHQFQSLNLPLGFLNDNDFKPKFDFFSFDNGDRVLFFSDGILEAKNKSGEFFGKKRILSVFDGVIKSSAVFDQLLKQVSHFQYGQEREEQDDLTLCEFTLTQPAFEIEKTGEILIKRIQDLDWGFQLELPIYALKKSEPVPLLIHFLLEYPPLLAHKEKLFLILSELYANALEHGVLGLDSAIKSKENGFALFYQEKSNRLAMLTEGLITITVKMNPLPDGGEIWITIQDSGKGFRDADIYSGLKNNAHPSGRGIGLVKKLCQSLEYSNGGTRVKACYRW